MRSAAEEVEQHFRLAIRVDIGDSHGLAVAVAAGRQYGSSQPRTVTGSSCASVAPRATVSQ